MPSEKEILKKKIKKARNGWILKVDLEYPAELHKDHYSYPLAPEKNGIKKGWLSEYQKYLMRELDLTHEKNLLLTLEDKRNYMVHYRNLQFNLQ